MKPTLSNDIIKKNTMISKRVTKQTTFNGNPQSEPKK